MINSHAFTVDGIIGKFNGMFLSEIHLSLPKCPECGSTLGLTEVNCHPGMVVDEKYQSMLFCNRCDYEEYLEYDIAECLRKSGLNKQMLKFFMNIMKYERQIDNGGVGKKFRRRIPPRPCGGCGKK